MIRMLATLSLLGSVLSAQAAFTQLTPVLSPSPRAGAIGVSDGALLYHFGGKPSSTTELNDMWIFDGMNWTDVTPSTGVLPAPRDWYGASYDIGRGRYVLFGGRSTASGGNLSDTWEFDGTTWTQMSPLVSPSTRRWGAMAYDVATGVTILFGGENLGIYNNETWSWDGTTWTQLSPVTSPSIRGRGRLSYDLTRDEMIYFGGRSVGVALGDTWVWDGSNWSETVTANAPSTLGVVGRFAYGMTYDLLRDRHVLFGGTRNGPTLSDVWEFDGSNWEQRTVSGPLTRTGPTFAYVIGLQKTFLFGGYGGPQLGDTWEYQTTALPSAVPYGLGCAGPGGGLALASTSSPWAGDVWTATCSNLGPTSLAMEVWGLSQSLLPLNVVLSIAPVGCNLLNTADLLLGPSISIAGEATVQFALPNNPALAGAVMQLQIAELQFDPGGNWIGLYTSNGLTMTIGAR
jgi:hypothetical protein